MCGPPVGGCWGGGGKGCQPPRGQVGMGLPRGDERVRGGRAFKGGGAPRLGLGPEAALKVMAHSGPRAGGGSPQGVVGEGGTGGGLEVEKGFSRVGMELRGGQRKGTGRARRRRGGGGAPRLGLGPEAALKVMAHSGPRAGGGGHRRGLWVKGAGEGLA